MPTIIKTKNSVTATNVPSSLQQGEVAINITDKKVWVGNAATTPILLLGSGADGTFTNLTVSGVASFADGTVSLPSITNIGDTNTGIFFPAADTIAFTEGGTEVMRITSAGDVSVASANAGARSLSVYNSDAGAGSYSQFYIQTNNGYFIQSLGSTANGGVASFYATSTGGMYHYTSGATPFYFGTNSTERMRITSTGLVGIGTSAPTSPLTISYAATIDNSGAANKWTTRLFDATAMAINVGGSVLFQGDKGTGAGNFAGIAGLKENGTSGNEQGYLGFYTTPSSGVITERMRIDSSGNLLVGTTDSGSGGLAARVRVGSDDNGVVSFATTANGWRYQSNALTNGGTFYHINFLENGTQRGSITSNGSSTSYITSSDYRLKENIAPMTGALAKVAALKPVIYNWKSDGSSGQGFIAHELQQVVPECVVGEKDAVNEDGSIKAQGIDTSFLVATLTAAIQEQQALIENLTTRLNALEGK
jgi:hypothetical protein